MDAPPAPLEAFQVEVLLPAFAHPPAILDRVAVKPQEYHVSDVRQVALKEVGGPDALLIILAHVADYSSLVAEFRNLDELTSSPLLVALK